MITVLAPLAVAVSCGTSSEVPIDRDVDPLATDVQIDTTDVFVSDAVNDGCSPVRAEGCADGETCVVNAEGDSVCTAAGLAEEGDRCDAGGSCAPGLVCAGEDATLLCCQRWCASDGDCPTDAGCVFDGAGLAFGLGTCAIRNGRCAVSGQSTE